MHANRNWLWASDPADGHAEIMFELITIMDSRHGLAFLSITDGGNFRANHAVIDEVQPEYRQPRVIACTFEIAIHQDSGEILSRIGNKIHRKKGEIADNVNVAQRRVKLYAVKSDYAGGQADEVFEVQITMTLTHETVLVSVD